MQTTSGLESHRAQRAPAARVRAGREGSHPDFAGAPAVLGDNGSVQIVIEGHNLPGRTFRNAGVPIHNVHVGVQVRSSPVDLVRADAPSATWTLEVRVVDDGDALDFGGPAVHGRRGERFVYLTWGDVDDRGGFVMFRRAKLMLDRVDRELVRRALDTSRPLRARVDLTDGYGGPRCARVDLPAVSWTV